MQLTDDHSLQVTASVPVIIISPYSKRRREWKMIMRERRRQHPQPPPLARRRVLSGSPLKFHSERDFHASRQLANSRDGNLEWCVCVREHRDTCRPPKRLICSVNVAAAAGAFVTLDRETARRGKRLKTHSCELWNIKGENDSSIPDSQTFQNSVKPKN